MAIPQLTTVRGNWNSPDRSINWSRTSDGKFDKIQQKPLKKRASSLMPNFCI